MSKDDVIEVTESELKDSKEKKEHAVVGGDNPSEAYGIIRDLDGLWKVVKVNYNVHEGTSTPPEVVYSELNRAVVYEQFRILVAKNLMS